MEKNRANELSMMRLLDRRREIVTENEVLREERKILKKRLESQRKTIGKKKLWLRKTRGRIKKKMVKILREVHMWIKKSYVRNEKY